MYTRFTDRAQKVMELADQEARRLHHEYIGTEHILLGLVREGEGVAANVLKSVVADLDRVRKEIEKIVSMGPFGPAPSSLKFPLTPRSKRAIEFAIEEARNLNHDYVGTEHLLLGLLREKEGLAAQVLMNMGATLDQIRREVLQVLGHDPDAGGMVESDTFSEKAEEAFRKAIALNETDYAWLMRRLQKRRPLK